MKYLLLCHAIQTHNAVHQPSVPDAVARAPGDALVPAHADIYDIQCLALHDGRPGRWSWLFPVLLEEIGYRRCDRTLSLTALDWKSNQKCVPGDTIKQTLRSS